MIPEIQKPKTALELPRVFNKTKGRPVIPRCFNSFLKTNVSTPQWLKFDLHNCMSDVATFFRGSKRWIFMAKWKKSGKLHPQDMKHHGSTVMENDMFFSTCCVCVCNDEVSIWCCSYTWQQTILFKIYYLYSISHIYPELLVSAG